jgi:dCMP deaminase
MAYFVAQKSKDPSTKCGTVIVGPDNEILTTGYNGLPRGVNDDLTERNERPEKYFWYEHGERNAVYNAARTGTALKGSTAYITGCPCCDCARCLIQSGVVRCVWDQDNSFITDPEKLARWKESMDRTMLMFRECGMVVDIIENFKKTVV